MNKHHKARISTSTEDVVASTRSASIVEWSARFKALATAAVLTVTSGTSVAEDVEIYTGVITNSAGVTTTIDQNSDFFPNILFILDNSTSMGETEPVLDRVISLNDDPGSGCNIDLASYDPDIDYSFGANSNDQNAYIYQRNRFTGKIVSPIQNQCQAFRDKVVDTPDSPVLTSQLIQWGFFRREGDRDASRWDGNINNFDNRDESAVECATDQGIHGHNTRNLSDLNARNVDNLRRRFNENAFEFYFGGASFGDDPYSGVETSDWASGNYHRYRQLVDTPSNVPASCPSQTRPASATVFDASAPLGTRLNPERTGFKVTDRGFCGGVDRDANTGRSTFKNRFFKVEDSAKDQILVYRCKTRLDTMKDALTSVLQNQTRLNAGLMRFNFNETTPHGGTVVSAISPMNVKANKDALVAQIEGLEFGKFTPISESLHEAYLYLSGKKIGHGRTTLGSVNSNHAAFDKDFLNPVNQKRTQFQTDPEARKTPAGDEYKSPMVSQCQPTSIVLLSDGEPTRDDADNDSISKLTGDTCSGNGGCAEEITKFMQDNDIAPSSDVNRNVSTYVVGLNIGVRKLVDIADAGQPDSEPSGSGFFRANDTAGLESAFRDILGQVQTQETDVFSAPAVTVNSFNRLQNRDDIYYALFRPEVGPRWAGNLKRYRVDGETESIVDVTGADAINPASGFFTDQSQSFWSERPDGPIVDVGGAASRLEFARRLFGNVNGTDVSLSSEATTAGGIDSEAVKQFLAQTVELNTNPVDLGAIGATGDLLNENTKRIAAWTLGLDVVDQGAVSTNGYIGDSLHGTPYVLSFGSSIADPKDVIFFTSNQGLLHAIDGETGNELWSYVVDTSLFSNLGNYFNNEGFDKIYGLDGEMGFRVSRDPATPEEIDGAALFFGQRRGGNKVFSVDVTNARDAGNNPVSRRWAINGGSGDFVRMGQTWAEPVITDVNYCDNDDGCGQGGTGRSVVFISGGYDEFYDNADNDISSVVDGQVLGNALYMVDADTGKLLWMAGSDVVDARRDLEIPEMIHSVVSQPTVLDSDGNGFADIIYFTDVAGQIFRIDFRTSALDDDSVSSASNFGSRGGSSIDNVSGGRIANFSEGAANRRFFNPLNITLLPQERDSDSNVLAETRYAIVTGSGYRAHPLDKESFGNRLFVIYDENVLLPLSDNVSEPIYTYVNNAGVSSIIESNDLTELEIVGGTTDSEPARLEGEIPFQIGYSVGLPRGAEKVLNPGLIADFAILFTTYTPSSNNVNNLSETCEAGLGISTFYALDLLPGSGSGLRAAEVLDNPGIAPTPVIVYTLVGGGDPVDPADPNGPGSGGQRLKPTIIVGTEPIKNEAISGGGSNKPPKKCKDFDDAPIVCPPDLGKAIKATWWEEGRAN